MKAEQIEKFNNIRKEYFGINDFIPEVYIHKQTGRLGIDVKWYNVPYRPSLKDQQYFYDEICASFWNKQCEIAKHCGYFGSFQEGRSGGWAMPMYKYDTLYYVYPPKTNGQENIPIADAIEIEKFNMFSSYVAKLLRLVKNNFKLIETIEDCRKLQKEIQEL